MSYLFPSPTITFEAALRDLSSTRAKARSMAAQALGDVTDVVEKRRAVEALVQALDDDHPEVRMEACASLGELAEPGALPHLVKRLDDGSPPVRQSAAIALGTLRHPDGFDALALALRDGPADLRFQAATSLVEIDPARAFEPVLAALADRDPQVVGAASLSLGAIGKAVDAHRPGAIAALGGLLDHAGGHADAAARFEIAYALAELGKDTGRAILAASLGDAERAWDAVSALGELRATDELAEAVTSKRTPAEARVLAAGKLLGLAAGSPPVRPDPRGSIETARGVLIEALTARKGHVRGLAVEQLAEVGGAWAKAALDKLARSGKGAEHLEAIARALRAIEGRP